MTAYYNEIDPFAAEWLRQLIKAGHIAPGEVDERSITDVQPDDLRGFRQCHFFAGIGVWSYALRQAGWGDEREVWTGSCPCQPFSVAGRGKGTDDERHLWPEFYRLIKECRPSAVFGEQVASKDGRAWLSTVRSEMETLGYGVGCADLCAAGVGAPELRQRLWFVAAAGRGRFEDENQQCGNGDTANEERETTLNRGDSPFSDMANPGGQPGQRHPGSISRSQETLDCQREQDGLVSERYPDGCQACYVGNASSEGSQRQSRNGNGCKGREKKNRPITPTSASCELEYPDCDGLEARRETATATRHGRTNDPTSGPTRGFWADCDWLPFRDGKWRPVEPGTFPLADGITNRVGRLRGYGNAIVAPIAQGFIESYMDCE